MNCSSNELEFHLGFSFGCRSVGNFSLVFIDSKTTEFYSVVLLHQVWIFIDPWCTYCFEIYACAPHNHEALTTVYQEDGEAEMKILSVIYWNTKLNLFQ